MSTLAQPAPPRPMTVLLVLLALDGAMAQDRWDRIACYDSNCLNDRCSPDSEPGVHPGFSASEAIEANGVIADAHPETFLMPIAPQALFNALSQTATVTRSSRLLSNAPPRPRHWDCLDPHKVHADLPVQGGRPPGMLYVVPNPPTFLPCTRFIQLRSASELQKALVTDRHALC